MSIANPRSGMEFGGATLRGTQYPDCHGRVLHCWVHGEQEGRREAASGQGGNKITRGGGPSNFLTASRLGFGLLRQGLTGWDGYGLALGWSWCWYWYWCWCWLWPTLHYTSVGPTRARVSDSSQARSELAVVVSVAHRRGAGVATRVAEDRGQRAAWFCSDGIGVR